MGLNLVTVAMNSASSTTSTALKFSYSTVASASTEHSTMLAS